MGIRMENIKVRVREREAHVQIFNIFKEIKLKKILNSKKSNIRKKLIRENKRIPIINEL